jgi:excisionase family DNA binding protein
VVAVAPAWPTPGAYLGVTDRTIRAMVADGRLTAYRGLGSRVLRIDLNEVDRVMESGGAA